jgi:hypothetical protein
MEAAHAEIFEDSAKSIGRLQLLAAHFQNDTLFQIYVRTQVIHRLFQTTPELNPDRLALYHLQFTESVIDLLRKVKRVNENRVLVLSEEVRFNELLLEKMQRERVEERQFEIAQIQHTALVNASINTLFQNLSDYAKDNPFPPALYEFSKEWAAAYYTPITEEQLAPFAAYNLEEEYKNGYGIIDKKLLGLQCRYGFKNAFVGGFRCGTDIVEVYKIVGTEDYFSFFHRKNFYNDFLQENLEALGWKPFISESARRIAQIETTIEIARTEAQTAHKILPADVTELLQNYLMRIGALNFLDDDDYESQANILRAMLQTDSL